MITPTRREFLIGAGSLLVLGVASEGHAICPSEALVGAISFSTVLSLPFALDGLVPQLAAALDGDSSTGMRSAS
jgi:iron complex transport system substrate-binding protein